MYTNPCKHVKSLGLAYKDHAACIHDKFEGTLDPIGKLFGNVRGVSKEPPDFDYERPAYVIVQKKQQQIQKPVVVEEKKRKVEAKAAPKKQEPKRKVVNFGASLNSKDWKIKEIVTITIK